MIIKISPRGSLDQLSQMEVDRLKQSAKNELYQLLRNCSLAVLASGLKSDNSDALFKRYANFHINVLQRERGLLLELINPPTQAFVDGEIIAGIQEHLFAVLRDIVYIDNKYDNLKHINLTNASHITNVVFDILRNARVISPMIDPNVIVCWGGHSINPIEYQYTREVGYELGLRALDICTGCGPGAMEGPMKGAAIGHAKQRIKDARYIGLTEPSIIAAEPPNQIVNELVIMPDIEKRLEAFVRLGHGIVIFPGGAGTAEELLYILGILLNPANAQLPFPLILTGPKQSADYFTEIDDFIGATLGQQARDKYQIIIDDPVKVAQLMKQGMSDVKAMRKQLGDAYQYQWALKIEPEFQLPFEPNHEVMKNLHLFFHPNKAELAASLRRAFSGIVAGNVKSETIKLIEDLGPFEISGDERLMTMMDKLLAAFVTQQRMKLPGSEYTPCYRINNKK
ncbi:MULTISPECIES: nucleotide 5'-monophosphate nucleosidase PpnN [unclassified Shewanella]|uniref:nucleotide 5'-monophosphate nucleosidase PpnN n=1 Tax=unclassified Shewanella TaxID=196818 RepID=UPI000C8288E0|nr:MULTISPECIES: nucleotide 5'-monophosphate nucleosidase PpnN [unclassified Shewanella]MDO6641167.1 nucleotide 5'-monophosphate nucleosidase PpnN [Shewanella sp. 5_MG-2023]MDO6678579.1 nucleotide 5'-monophosphate nucleosidase PpnN [Shewanella sp. 4_MG-2023]MDO6774679.1 nucleotide 5'-monophosphate nucleosidase PpnN [Shewanella sp. 3_MG-2023]PMG31974.1 LOG family protein [Shewanella sp. 10N.286.52.C2]PMH86018.1 LOG family protein [Shewanella sp. 10N.286.48.B5]